eukprot:CCRYP_007896-RC/>CCRYP_007896-RC protein AED:0.39 eAED:0.39 QI:341/1/1/1/1/1/3/411/445
MKLNTRTGKVRYSFRYCQSSRFCTRIFSHADATRIICKHSDAPASREEFDHDNDPEVCGLPILTVEEWEAGRYWEGNKPVIVKNVTAGWAAMEHWKKQEMLHRYPNQEATMGEARLVGETGPDEAGNRLSPTTIKEFVTKHMYDPMKYFFDRKISIDQGMLLDIHPFPMPTREYLEDPYKGAMYAPSKKRKVNWNENNIWRDHLAISIGADQQGFGFHHHREAWNVVLFGAKRWILYDHDRFKHNVTRQRRLVRDWDNPVLVSSPQWIRELYPNPERIAELRAHGHDCVQRAGEMMFVPRRWLHMVLNIGDTVAIISEIGLAAGEGKKEEDFMYDPDESSDDEEEEEEDSEDWEAHPGYAYGYRERQGSGGYRGPTKGYGYGYGEPPSHSDEEEGDSEDYEEPSEDYEEDYYPNARKDQDPADRNDSPLNRGGWVMMDQPYHRSD